MKNRTKVIGYMQCCMAKRTVAATRLLPSPRQKIWRQWHTTMGVVAVGRLTDKQN
jgi:hypothetical protein